MSSAQSSSVEQDFDFSSFMASAVTESQGTHPPSPLWSAQQLIEDTATASIGAVPSVASTVAETSTAFTDEARFWASMVAMLSASAQSSTDNVEPELPLAPFVDPQLTAVVATDVTDPVAPPASPAVSNPEVAWEVSDEQHAVTEDADAADAKATSPLRASTPALDAPAPSSHSTVTESRDLDFDALIFGMQTMPSPSAEDDAEGADYTTTAVPATALVDDISAVAASVITQEAATAEEAVEAAEEEVAVEEEEEAVPDEHGWVTYSLKKVVKIMEFKTNAEVWLLRIGM